MKFRLSNLILIASLAITLLPGCAGGSVRARLNEAEAMLDERPADALSILEGIDSTSLRFKPRRVRHALLRAIALDKNHKSDSGFIASVGEAARWYARFGNRHDKLRAIYYYGDQLRDAGMLEEAAVQLMLAEKEAVSQKDWFFAGMSARGLYYIFAWTHNDPEEVSSIKRAVEYFRLAGKEPHEDDARIKLAMAYYDNYELERSDSLFNECIRIAIQKRDTVRWRNALAGSTDVMLLEEPFRPDSAIARTLRSAELGRRLTSRNFAALAFSEALKGERNESEEYLKEAYKAAKDTPQKMAVVFRDYQIRMTNGDTSAAFRLLRERHDYVDSVAIKTLEQSVVKAQNMYLESSNENLTRNKRAYSTIILLILLLVVAFITIVILIYKKKRHQWLLAEEERNLEIDRYSLALEELGTWGLDSIDKISQAYYSSGNNHGATVAAFESVIAELQTDSSLERLLDNIDKSHGEVITKFKTQLPSIGRERVLLFAFFVQGLPYTTISVILGGVTKTNMYNRRQRLIETIKEKNPQDRELFLSYLHNRPTRG